MIIVLQILSFEIIHLSLITRNDNCFENTFKQSAAAISLRATEERLDNRN